MECTARVRPAAACLALVLAAGAAAASPPRYTLTDIPSVTGSMHNPMAVYGINNDGAITGQSATRAFFWTPGSAPVDIHPSPSVLGSVGRGIGPQGQVMGDACIPPAGGGNGACGYYLFGYTPGEGTRQVNGAADAAMFAGVGSFECRFGDNGEIAGTANPYYNGARALYHSDATGWLDLTTMIPNIGAGGARVAAMTGSGVAMLDAGAGRPLYIYTPWWGVTAITEWPVSARAMNNSLAYTGAAPFAHGEGAFRAGPCMPPADLDPLGLFPGSIGEFINEAGMIAGTWDGGVFLYTDETGMVDLGLDHPGIEIIGMNQRGDIAAAFHTALYAPVSVVKLMGEPVMLAQNLIDPMRTRLIVDHVSSINDSGQFVATGRRPGSPAYAAAMLATASPDPSCAADADRNGAVNSGDISAYLTLWLADVGGQTHGVLGADANGSGATNSSDISAFLTGWLGAVSAGGC